ncbi:MAG TPA: hypothetical protein VIJ34_11430 [Acidimicrobiales bacterium]
MFNRFAIAAAVAATMFGLAGAGASLLGTSGSATAVQQTNAISATCQPGNVNFANVASDNDVVSTRLFQQSIESQCGGNFVQVALTMTNGAVAYSNTVWIPTSNVTSPTQESFLLGGSTDLAAYGYAVYGEDLYPQFPAGVLICGVQSTTITIAGQIDTPSASPATDKAGSVTGTLPTSC